MNREERAWAAGFFDGEGTAYVKNRDDMNKPFIILKAAQKGDNVGPLLRMQEALGVGKVYGPYSNGSMAEFRCYGEENFQLAAERMWPWLGEAKKKQILAVWRNLVDAQD